MAAPAFRPHQRGAQLHFRAQDQEQHPRDQAQYDPEVAKIGDHGDEGVPWPDAALKIPGQHDQCGMQQDDPDSGVGNVYVHLLDLGRFKNAQQPMQPLMLSIVISVSFRQMVSTHIEQFLVKIGGAQPVGDKIAAQGCAKGGRPAEPDTGIGPVRHDLAQARAG